MSRKDADIRLHTGWLTEPWFTELVHGDTAAGIAFVLALMQSMKNDGDGHLPPRLLATITSDGVRSPTIETVLIASGRCIRASDGGLAFLDWEKKATDGGLGQSTSQSIENARERKRINKRSQREREAAERAKTLVSPDMSPVTKASMDMPNTANVAGDDARRRRPEANYSDTPLHSKGEISGGDRLPGLSAAVRGWCRTKGCEQEARFAGFCPEHSRMRFT